MEKPGIIDQTVLRETRKKMHQAVQLVSAFARNLLPPDPGDESASLHWNRSKRAFESHPVNHSGKQFVMGLQVEDFLLYLQTRDEITREFDLRNKSVNQALQWLRDNATANGLNGTAIDLELPYEIESYDYSRSLKPDNRALKEFAVLYDSTYASLERFMKVINRTEPIRCWPHHFDLAILIPLATDQDGEMKSSSGVGLAPGDEGLDQPYIYVNAWPSIDLSLLEGFEMKLGRWNSGGWSGAVLPYSEISGDDFPDNGIDLFIKRSFEIISGILNG